MSFDEVFKKLEKLEDKVETRFDKFDTKLDNLDGRLDIYNQELTRHIEGVKLAREENKLLKVYIESETKELENRIDPIQRHIDKVNITMKVLAQLGALLLTIIGIYATYKSTH